MVAVDTKSVLIVDDDLDIRDSLAEVLEIEGYRVAKAKNGREALRMLQTGQRPAVILLDLMMPVMNGWQFRAAQASDPTIATIPVVVLTADSNAREKAAEIGAQAFLRKPLDLRTLLDTIGRWAA
jgi:CheY-like chemotaxis protein